MQITGLSVRLPSCEIDFYGFTVINTATGDEYYDDQGLGFPEDTWTLLETVGREGDSRKATRTIKVDMNDKMRFSPDTIQIQRGEVVRFEVKNSGKVMHEMVLGTLKELKEHAELMRKHPGMEHDEPYMAHVAPGKTEKIVWQFTKAGEFFYGCLVPGHFEAGMMGKVVVR